MLKKINLSAIIFALFLAVSASAQTEEGFEKAVSSNLTKISLPANAMRIAPQAVPSEITQTLEKFVAAGEGKIRQGDSEVLVWTGKEYQLVGQQATINRLMDSMKTAGWKYEVGGAENGITIFSLLKEGAKRRALMGFYGESDGTLVLAWTEVLPVDGDARQTDDPAVEKAVEPVKNGGGSIVGTWGNGSTAMMGEKYQNGTVASRGGTTFKYVFHPNGAFEFTGYAESTLYGCTTSLFQDKRGKYSVKGDQITLTLTKNFWRNQYSCSPGSNKERNYTLTPETYAFRIRRNDYGRDEICLATEKGEACYERRQE